MVFHSGMIRPIEEVRSKFLVLGLFRSYTVDVDRLIYKAIDSWLKKAIKAASLSQEKIREWSELINKEERQKNLPDAVEAIKSKRSS
jgi:hypothetical protein